MKRNAIVRIILFSIALFALLAILSFSLGTGSLRIWAEDFDSKPMVDSGDTVSTSCDAAGIRELEIEWAAGSITIFPDEYTTKITVIEPKMNDDKYQMRCVQSGNKLGIQFHDPEHAWIFRNETVAKDLTIIVPADWNCEDLQIDAASASIQMSDLKMLDVEINGASGICNFTNCSVDDLEVNTASGDVTFNGALNQLDFKAASANCHLTLNNVPFGITMESMSGDLTLDLPEDAGFALEMDALSGEFTSDFATTMQDGRHVCGNGMCRISISALSGDVNIRKHTAHHDEAEHH